MQPVGPYRIIELLGQCQVGSVWSALDEQGQAVAVAALDPTVATDQRWRDAFAATANALAQGEPAVTFVRADFAAAGPWAAYPTTEGPGAEQVFRSLGMDYRPASPGAGAGPDRPSSPAGPSSTADDPNAPIQRPDVLTSAQPDEVGPQPDESATTGQPEFGTSPASGVPYAEAPYWAAYSGTPQSGPPYSGYPQSGPPYSGYPQSGPPYSGPPYPFSGPPQPISGTPASPGPQNSYDTGYSTTSQPADPFTTPGRRIVPSPPPPRRRPTRLWIGIGALVLVLLAGGGTIFALTSGDDPAPKPSGGAATPTEVPLPTAAALQPGREPPTPGAWPTAWPTFTPADGAQPVRLQGMGFPFSAPKNWQCVPAGSADGFVKYTCGESVGKENQVGGEIIVRTCPQPCNEERRVAMRRAEEAWSLQWRQGSRLAAYAESPTIEGAQRYGLIIVSYWRSEPDAAVDRQFVLRMTAPADKADIVRKVATSIPIGVR